MKFPGLTKISFRSRIILITVGVVLAIMSLFYTYKLADVLRQKEQHDVELWVAAMERVSREAFGNYLVDPLISHIVSTHNNIPFIITDELKLFYYNGFLTDTCLTAQDHYKALLDYFKIRY